MNSHFRLLATKVRSGSRVLGEPCRRGPFQIGTRTPQAIDLNEKSDAGRLVVLEFAPSAPYIALPGRSRARASGAELLSPEYRAVGIGSRVGFNGLEKFPAGTRPMCRLWALGAWRVARRFPARGGARLLRSGRLGAGPARAAGAEPSAAAGQPRPSLIRPSPRRFPPRRPRRPLRASRPCPQAGPAPAPCAPRRAVPCHCRPDGRSPSISAPTRSCACAANRRLSSRFAPSSQPRSSAIPAPPRRRRVRTRRGPAWKRPMRAGCRRWT